MSNALASYGQKDVTLDNFPQKLGPVLGLASRAWDLPINPTTLLVPAKIYIKGLLASITQGLDAMQAMPKEEVGVPMIGCFKGHVILDYE